MGPASPAELRKDRAGTPSGVRRSKRDDPSLDLGGDLVWTPIGSGAPVGERAETLVRVADEPSVDRATVDPVAGGDVGDVGPIDHLPDREVALLNHG